MALALGFAAIVGCGDNGVTPPDAPDIDAPPDAPPLPPAQLALSPLTSDFGTITTGQTSSSMSFTVTNTGGDVSGSISASIMGSGAANFSIETNGCTTLAANATCTVAVSFSPQSVGQKTANLVVSSSPGGSVSAAIDGIGAAPGSLSISPASNPFGDVVVGATSTSTATFTITNPGGTPTGTLNVVAAGSDPGQFTKQSDTCDGQVLAASATCVITVSFSPNSPGMKSASFQISGSPGGTVAAAVTGNALAQAALSINPSLELFGSIVVGATSSSHSFTVTNSGGVASGAIANATAGTDMGMFTIVSSNCAGAMLAPAASCNIIVQFSPTSTGGKAAQLNVTATPGGTPSATLLGDGIAPGQLTITQGVPFADTTVGATSASQTYTVTNTGGAPTGALATALGGNDPNQFTVVNGSNGCQGVVLAPAANCTIAITFTPTTGGAKSASLTVSGTPGGAVNAGLSGNGIPGALLTISPLSNDFGSVGIGAQTAFQTFTITNTGGQTSGVPAVSLNGAQAGQFNFVSACTMALAPTQSCTVQVRFAPTVIGNSVGSIDITAAPGGTASGALFGQGVNPAALSVNPTSLDFDGGDGPAGQVLIGENQMLQFVLTNNGTEPTGTITFSITGAAAGDYSQTNNCTFLVMGQSCTVVVTFAPSAAGTRAASISASATPGGSVSVAVTGDALPRLELLTPATNPYVFADTIINTLSPPTVTVTVRNNRSTTQTLTQTPTNVAANAGAGASSDYHFTGGTCGATLAGYASCTRIVAFEPDTVGNNKAGSVLFAIGAGAINQATQSFLGDGVDSLSITPATVNDFMNVARGTASGTLTFNVYNPANAPTSGPIGTVISGAAFQIVSDTCAGTTLAANTTCSIQVRFLPTTNGTQSSTLTVTGAPGGSPQQQIVGTGVDPANLQFNPNTTLAFGNVFSGETGTQTIVVSNPAGAAVSGPVQFSKAGGDSGLYTFLTGAGGDCVNNVTTLAAGASCNIRISFAPVGTAFGTKNAMSVSISANPGTTATKVINVTGTSVSTLSVSPPSHNYGTRDIGSTTSQAFTVRNDSNNTVNITSTTPPAAAGLTILSNTCGGNLTSLNTCVVTVRFAPAAAGTVNTTLTVNSANGLATATLAGHGNTPSDVNWTETFSMAAPYNYGVTLAGELGPTRVFTLRNDGESTATAITGILLSDAVDYSVTATNCIGTALTGGATCTVSVRYNPMPSNGMTADQPTTVMAMGPTGMSNTTINLLGRRMESGSVIFAPVSATYAPLVTGGVSATQTIMATNTGATTASFISVVVNDQTAMMADPSLHFTLVGGTCGAVVGGFANVTLAQGTSCTLVVQFNPTALGALTGYLMAVKDNLAANVPISPYAPVFGTGLAPANIMVSTNAPPFPATGLTRSSQSTVTLTNLGQVSTGTISQSAITGTDAALFSKSGCTGTLAPAGQAGDSCTITITFTPNNVGSKAASFTVGATPGLATTVISLNADAVVNASLGLTPLTQVNAGSRAVGALDPTGAVFTLNNGGAVPSGNLSLTALNANYVLDGGFAGVPATCVFGAPLAPGATCQFRVKFNPIALGTHVATVTVSANPGGTVNGSITGVGTSAITVTDGDGTPTSHDFGTVAAGGTSGARTFTFTNNAAVPTGLLYTARGGANLTDFSLAGAMADECAGKVLTELGGAADSCTITVRFTPHPAGGTGMRTSTVTVSATPGNSAQATLTGTAN